jgi:hypothetical protein
MEGGREGVKEREVGGAGGGGDKDIKNLKFKKKILE